jgi:hypothetical protein
MDIFSAIVTDITAFSGLRDQLESVRVLDIILFDGYEFS